MFMNVTHTRRQQKYNYFYAIGRLFLYERSLGLLELKSWSSGGGLHLDSN